MTDQTERTALNALSARIGADPALVQAAGGNTSVKIGDVMWVKASGTWLMQASTQDIFVPVALQPLRDALDRNDPACEKAQDFVIQGDNPRGLRPSIETTVHAVFGQRVVVHVHCVETIALSVRRDAEARLAPLLSGFDWLFIPYVRPGLPLSKNISERLSPDTNVVVLGNHGLVVAGDTVEEASDLLDKVCERLAQPVRLAPQPDVGSLRRFIGGESYRVSSEPAAHGAATDGVSCRIAAGGSLYPDHVIFLGPGSAVARPGEDAAGVASRMRAAGSPDPVAILVPGAGVVVHETASPGAIALARCLADVAARIPDDASVHYLSDDQEFELTHWDAEKYRQSLNQASAEASGD